MQDIIKKTARELLSKRCIELLIILKHSRSRLPHHGIYVAHVAGKNGIEIGGPSLVFKTALPLYQKVGALDGVNFSNSTVWEGSIAVGQHFNFVGSRKGKQFVAEASDLSAIEDQTYDFLLSSNCLEHVANPIKALMEWRRVIRPGGSLVLVLPNKLNNFDHKRPTTSLAHLIEDFENDVNEGDLTHLDEILDLHDLAMDPLAGDLQQFRARSLKNLHNRTLHHHVFDLPLMQSMLMRAGFEVLTTAETPADFFALATKS